MQYNFYPEYLYFEEWEKISEKLINRFASLTACKMKHMSNTGQFATHQTPACHNIRKHFFQLHISWSNHEESISSNSWYTICGKQTI